MAVETVQGPIDGAELGPTLAHEHVFILTADVQRNWPDEWGDEDTRVADHWADPAARESLPRWQYLHIQSDVLPALRERGVTGEQIDAMLVTAARRWLEAGN